jgi:hypothetical protein
MTSSITRDPDASRIATVLAGIRFPALAWQLVAQADYYGADAQTRAELAALPAGQYPNMPAVLAKLREARCVRTALHPTHRAARPATSVSRHLRVEPRVGGCPGDRALNEIT